MVRQKVISLVLTLNLLALPMHKQHRGFTLIELMVTTAVAGIALGMAAPQLSGYNANNKIKNSAREFQSLVQLARSEAITNGTFVTITGTLANDWSGDITLCSSLVTNTPCTSNNATLIKTANLGKGEVTIDSSKTLISFNSRGRLEGGADVEMFFYNLNNPAATAVKKLTINPTGRPRVESF